MTKKDFILIAQAIRIANNYSREANLSREGAFLSLVETMSNLLANTNLKFKREAFAEACKLRYEPVK